MESKSPLTFGKQLAYASGQMGWSILINVISLMLVYFYLPPDDASLPGLITQATFLGVLNAVTLIAASGRLVDAITDPLIASFSDRSTHRRGRRIPFMLVGALPAALFLVLMFFPPIHHESGVNILWLLITQMLFYVCYTVYVTPFFALLPELGHTAKDRLNLSTWLSITYALGIVVAAQTPLLVNLFESLFNLSERLLAFQYAVTAMSVLALALMLIPVLTIDEKKYCVGKPSTAPMLPALRSTFRNLYFRFYVIADFSYFMGLAIIQTGLLYYVTVLLEQEEVLVSTLLTVMVLVSFVFYPLVNMLAQKLGKKWLVVASFLAMSVTFLVIYFLGHLPLGEQLQAYLVVMLYAVPLSFLSVLPNAVLADIAEYDALKTGERKEGMFFAARTLMQKFGQTFGILVFAALTSLGKDPGDDLGVRLSGLVGFGLCVTAGLVFVRYDETRLLREMQEMQEA